MKVVYTTDSPEQSIRLGEEVGKRLRGGDIIAYRGDLGAGKTTFTRGLSMGLGLGDDVTSPTFTLVNEYRKADTKLDLIHFDMYRISGAEDLETTGFYDYLDGNNVLAVEWSENIADELPQDCIRINIERVDDSTRIITLDGDERFADIGN
jgi:tRNA threonylcarbamoyladenosine biosynthesis protein TsaE